MRSRSLSGYERCVPRCISAATILVGVTGFISPSVAQVFSDPAVSYTIETNQTAQTIDTDLGVPICSVPWPGNWNGSQSLSISQMLTEFNGGCPHATLRRDINAQSRIISNNSISVVILCGIRANLSSQIGQVGFATGQMSAQVTGSVVLHEWVTADIAWIATANQALQQAQTWLGAELVGPVDPLTNQGALIHESWSGTTSTTMASTQRLLAPGRYELRTTSTGSLVPAGGFVFAAQSSASLDINHWVPTMPPTHLDLTGDGVVNLDDACAWADQPTDANQDGLIDALDLQLIMALARAGDDDVTDTNGDGLPDQCTCVADWNADGVLDFFDVQGFLAAYSAGQPSADLTGDGLFDFFDVLRFLSLFSGGC